MMVDILLIPDKKKKRTKNKNAKPFIYHPIYRYTYSNEQSLIRVKTYVDSKIKGVTTVLKTDINAL